MYVDGGTNFYSLLLPVVYVAIQAAVSAEASMKHGGPAAAIISQEKQPETSNVATAPAVAVSAVAAAVDAGLDVSGRSSWAMFAAP